jgi:putrescine:ornithine antiporter
MLGTLGAAVVYILSTTVIQGIVPNAELANSTGPFGFAYAKMFNPTIGSIIMGLAILACLGSLLGWQFTIAQTAKSAADDRMFPAIFSKENRLGAPVMGMIVMGIVQTAMALSTISPTLSEQFNALVNLAVVTNVLPYIISLSALTVIMQKAGVTGGQYKLNNTVAVIATLYSTYAIYASGKDAVLGGMLVLGITYIIWGFIAPRFTAGRPAAARVSSGAAAAVVAAFTITFLAALLLPPPAVAAEPVTTLASIKKTAKVKLGYHADARPFSFRDESGNAAGYTVDLCQKIAEQVKTDLGLSSLAVEWVPVPIEGRFGAVRDGKVDLLCGADTVTLSRRKEVSFSIPIYLGGIGALLRSDALAGLSKALSERAGPSGPLWRGTPTEQLLQVQTFAVVGGTTSEKVLAERLGTFQLSAKVVTVKDYASGVQAVVDRKASVFFGDRPILLDAAKRAAAGELKVHERRFTDELLALALRRGDEEFRLEVDRTLSRLYRSPEFRAEYSKWFGEPDERASAFRRLIALPE